jgi:hypothetical protein
MNTQTGIASLRNLGTGGATALCRNASNQISTCSSSLRYKTNIASYDSGLSLIMRLRPVTFNWRENNLFDFGLVAEDVAEIEPLLATFGIDGRVEGVKYDRLGVVLVNAVGEQQHQIEDQKRQIEAQAELIRRQQSELDELKSVVCSMNPSAEFCKRGR